MLSALSGLSNRRNTVAVWNLLRAYPAFWEPRFWTSLTLARQAQARGAMQKVRELAPLLGLLQRRPPRVVVEIGTARGGTFFAWCRVARPEGVIVSIDLPGGRFGGGYASGDILVLQRYGGPKQQLHFIRDDSHAAGTRATLEEILQGEKIDFLMIDGDHTYDGVRQDFEMYAPLVGEGKPIAFHDILPHPHEASCEVDRFWGEIKNRYRHLEFLDLYSDRRGQQYGGIGIVYWQGDASSGTA